MSVESNSRPSVSVVIPTHQRPEMVCDAVQSALAQTFGDLEVIVVVDGSHAPTIEALGHIRDERLRVEELRVNIGNAGARNAGIQRARGRWIALLDDDDLWSRDKLKLQLATAERSVHPYPILSCRLTATNERGSFVWPRTLPRPQQPVSEYLFCRRRPASGEGLVQTSTILAPTELFRKQPFRVGLKRLVDLDWLLRAARVPGTGIEFVPSEDPLVTWRIEEGRSRISNELGWRWDVDWIRERRQLVTSRAYSAFLLTLPSVRAAREGDRSAFLKLLLEAFSQGQPGVSEVAYHLGNFCLPRTLRAALAAASHP